MKRLSQIIFIIGCIAIAGIVTFAVAMLASQALGQRKKEATRVECKEIGNEHIVTIQDDRLSINDLSAKLCDKLTIANEDDQLRLMAFGVHENHKMYNGITERTLEKGQRMSVTLNEAGSYTFHDHLNDEFMGQFTVE